MYVLKQTEIKDETYMFSAILKQWECSVTVYGEKYAGTGSTKERARTRAVLLAEFVLFPDLDITEDEI